MARRARLESLELGERDFRTVLMVRSLADFVPWHAGEVINKARESHSDVGNDLEGSLELHDQTGDRFGSPAPDYKPDEASGPLGSDLPP